MHLLHRQQDPVGLIIRPTVIVAMAYLMAASCYWIYWSTTAKYPPAGSGEELRLLTSGQFWGATAVQVGLVIALVADGWLIRRSDSTSRNAWLVGIVMAVITLLILQFGLAGSTEPI